MGQLGPGVTSVASGIVFPNEILLQVTEVVQ